MIDKFTKFTDLIKDKQIIMFNNDLKFINKTTKYPFKINDNEVLISLNDMIYLIYNKKTTYIECFFNDSLKYIQSSYYLNNLKLSEGYVKFILDDIKQVNNCLILGLCIGNMPNELVISHKSIKKIDCVEINPLLCIMYNQYFKISNKINVYNESAIDFVNKTNNIYDTIIIDIPYKIITSKFIKKVKSLLSENGKVYVNIFGSDSKRNNNKLFTDFNNINYTKIANNNLYILY